MRFNDIAKRVNGFSTPFGGISWTASDPETAVAHRVIAFLEDRRVLYNPSSLELPEHCIESVLQIRQHVTNELGGLNPISDLAIRLRAIRASCRKFMDRVGADPQVLRFGTQSGHYASWTFLPALGELRSEIGKQAALIAVCFKIDVEDELASTFPASDEEGGVEDY